MLDNYEFLVRKREEFANEPIIPPPLVRGDDLIALGFKPGPEFGQILEAVETRQLEGSLRSHDEALEWVKREYSLSKEESKKTPNAQLRTPNAE
jgi:poly(A) polymerase